MHYAFTNVLFINYMADWKDDALKYTRDNLYFNRYVMFSIKTHILAYSRCVHVLVPSDLL